MSLSRVVILEGCDGSGKTTLANYLHQQYNYRIIKTGPPAPDRDVAVTYLDALHDALTYPGRTLFDRHYLGEAVYGPLLRGVDKMGQDGLAIIERVIAARGVKLIICSPPWGALVKGWSGKDDLLKKETQLRWVNDQYLYHAERLSLQPYDWTATDAETTLKEMLKI